MKIDDMRALANTLLAQDAQPTFDARSWRANAVDLAHAISDLLSVGDECGYTITGDVDEDGPHVKLMDDRLRIEEAHSVAVSLLRARDEAEAKPRG